MRSITRRCEALTVAAGLALTCAAAAHAAQEPTTAAGSAGSAPLRTAVNEFGWSTVATSVQAAFGTNLDIGKGIRALLITRLHQAGGFQLIDPGAPSGGAGSAQMPVDLYLSGDVVTFGRDDRDRRVALGQFGLFARVAGGLASRRERRAVVTISYRFVDAASGAIVAAGEAHGESTRTSRALGGLLGRSGGVASGAVDMSSRNFAETIIGEAVIAATDRLAAAANQSVAALHPRP